MTAGALVGAFGRVRRGVTGAASAVAASSMRTRVTIAGGLVAAVAGGVTAGVLTAGTAQTTFTARFPAAPGLYVGNYVDVLGMPVGKVTAVTPGPTYVAVSLQVPNSVPIPANTQALIMAPQIVNDRYVQLSAYRGGPRLADHAVIPPSRTAVPVSVDGIIDSLDDLAKALGPNGANARGALSAFVASAAQAFGNNGAALHATLTSLGSAFAALSSKSPDLTALFDNLGNLSQVASQYTATYQSFANNLAAVSTELSSDDSDIGSALSNLQQALAALAQFATTNTSALGKSLTNLDQFTAAIAAAQRQVAQVYETLPIALNNLTQAYDPNAPGGPALRARLDPMGNSAPFSQALCGDSLLRLLLLSIDPSQDNDPNVDLACGVNGVLAQLPTPPGASSGPNLSLSALVGGQP
ncbi:MAG TPA: MCE family protein [Acidimicrobiales bacterium]|nr:MCE family protein [Acidimicrobiales bacterium]